MIHFWQAIFIRTKNRALFARCGRYYAGLGPVFDSFLLLTTISCLLTTKTQSRAPITKEDGWGKRAVHPSPDVAARTHADHVCALDFISNKEYKPPSSQTKSTSRRCLQDSKRLAVEITFPMIHTWPVAWCSGRYTGRRCARGILLTSRSEMEAISPCSWSTLSNSRFDMCSTDASMRQTWPSIEASAEGGLG